jgi:LacI family transcriptional regulator
VRISHRLGLRVVVDATGPALTLALGAGPDIVAPNLAEAEQALLGTRAEEVEAAGLDVVGRAAESVRGLVAGGARFAIVTAGSHGAAFGDRARVYWCRAPAVEVTNPIGSGDALVAGLLASLGRGDDLPEAVRAAVAAASASCEEELPGTLVASRAADLRSRLPPNELVWPGPGRRRPAGPERHDPASRRGEAGPARARGSGRRPLARREAAGSSTLRDVARAAGVSIKTISRVVNGDAEVTIETAARVREVIAALGYRPNPLARSLRTGYDQALGLVVERIGDEFFAAVIEAIEESARERGLFLIVASTGTSPEQERAAVDGLLHRSVCGLIVVPSGLDYSLERFAIGPGKAPVVFVDRPPAGMEADTVVIDNRRAAAEATSHLLGHGHRRIAFVTQSLEQYTLRNRFEGYREALAERGVAYDESIVLVNPAPMTDVSRSLVELLGRNDPPTAIFSSNTVASVRVAQALHSSRRTDIAFVAFDDFNTADSLVPAVTVVRQDPTLIARSATELLFQRLDGDETSPKRLVVATQLVARGSGELPAGRRPRAP